MLPQLQKIDEKGINYYFSFTLNDYEKEGFEPNVRKVADRINTFKTLSEKIGRDKVIWRFDPLIMTDTIDVQVLLDRIFKIGEQLSKHTNKLVISFADISTYRKVRSNLHKHKVNYKEFNPETMIEVAKGLKELNKTLGLEISTCWL